MKIDYPSQDQLPRLQQLWQEAFQEDQEFISLFFSTAFSPDRCQCVTVDGELAGALYWMDCRLQDKPVAYLYAIATGKKYRRRGICRRLMERTQQLLEALGYAGILLVPGDHHLRSMYAAMGYETATAVAELSVAADEIPVLLEEISSHEYADLRKSMLPDGSVVQEGACLDLLADTCRLYRGNGFLLAAAKDGNDLQGVEFLGDPSDLPGIVKALGKPRGRFRTPGEEIPFAMWRPLTQIAAPRYFGLAFD